jgi:hypothetical protein
MTPLELAIRHVADNDFQGRGLRRCLHDLAALIRQKGPAPNTVVDSLVRAYDDEWRQVEAEFVGLCRGCKAKEPLHFHAEPRISHDGTLGQTWERCNLQDCKRHKLLTSSCCEQCLPAHLKGWYERRAARYARLRAHGATTWMPDA